MKPSALRQMMPMPTTTGELSYGKLGQHQLAVEDYDGVIRLKPGSVGTYLIGELLR